MEFDFWGKNTHIWRAFCLRSSLRTWLRLIERIAAEAASVGGASGGRLRWLDVGTGDGLTIWSTLQALNDMAGSCHVELTAVEPDPSARRMLASLLIGSDQGGPVSLVADNLDTALATGQSWDLITFVHSTYYLSGGQDGLRSALRKCCASLETRGRLVIVALPEQSVFWQVAGNAPPTGTAEAVERVLDQSGVKWKSEAFRMLWRISGLAAESTMQPGRVDDLMRFFEGSSRAEFTAEDRARFVAALEGCGFEEHGGKWVDFADVLIAGQKC